MKEQKAIMENKLDSMLKKRGIDIQETITKIENDGLLLNDFLPFSKQLNFGLNTDGQIAVSGFNGSGSTFSKFSFGQISERMGIPSKYMHSLNENGSEWQRNLAVDVLNRHAEYKSPEKFLIRQVDDRIRGVLSERYRRLNTSLIFQTYLMSAMNQGAVLIDAYSNDDIDFIEVVSPELVKVELANAPTMWQIFGARLRNSNFGKSALQLQSFTINLVCTNGMIGENIMREVHLGGRIPDNISVSQETVEKDTEAIASIVRDTVNTIYDKTSINNQVMRLKNADSIIIDIPEEIKRLPKIGVQGGEISELETILMNGNEGDSVAGEPTLLKLTQGMTAVARNRREINGERSRDLEEIASKMLMNRVKV